MILGIIMALIAGFIAFMLPAGNCDSSRKSMAFGIAAAAVTTALVLWVSYALDNYWLETGIAEYRAFEQTYYGALDDERLSGFERIELTKLAAEENQKLAKTKISINKPWGAWLDRGLVAEYMALEPVG